MTRKPLSLKITSHHFLMCVLQTLLWGVTNTNPILSTALTTVVTKPSTMTTLSTTKLPPNNTVEFKSVGQNETSISLQWSSVDAFINYTLKYSNGEINVPASAENETVTYVVSDLKSGTKYDFTLFTVFENVRSTGVNLTAVTAPPDVKQFGSVGQNETSISLQWSSVDAFINYTLKYSNGEIHVPASAENETVTYVVSDLKSGTKYDFTLFTVFENVRSTGVNLTAVTAPNNTEEFKAVGQNETSLTLQWKEVDAILNYTLQYSNGEINVPASAENETVTYVVSDLKSGTKYVFTLFTVYENVRSTGVNLTAVTAPPDVKQFGSVGQNETSISLQWSSVDAFINYTLKYSNGEIHVPASAENETVTYVVSDLKSGTKYVFTLFTVYENVRSTGVNLTAVTAPPDVKQFGSVGQNETSISLQWSSVDAFINYTLKYSNGEIHVPASAENETVTYVVSDLKSGTKYDFTLFTVFENVRSTGVNLTAVTAPNNTEEFKAVGQNETSITLQWSNVDATVNYTLQYSKKEINVPASAENETVTYVVSDLKSGTKYDFTLFTVFENVRSTGVNLTAVTAPNNTEEFKAVGQNETSITLQWKEVDAILNYTLQYSNREINVPASAENETVTYIVSDLKSGTKYDFTLFTVYENVRSTGVNLTAVTAPENVKNVIVLRQNESSITLMWDKVNNISNYILQYEKNGSFTMKIISVSHREASVTYDVSSLDAGKKYNFTLITEFEGVNSTGYRFSNVTVPPKVPFVNVSERLVTSITLMWTNVDRNWNYLFHINGSDVADIKNVSSDVVSHSTTSLKSGTMYKFSVTTVFYELHSTAYEDFIVTAIDCASIAWHVSNSSIQGMVGGLFSNATASNGSQTHVSLGGNNVSFTGLYPGATYEVSLVYQAYQQCRHTLTVFPPDVLAHCEYWGAGYSIRIVWDKPDGLWSTVEVNVTGRTLNTSAQYIVVDGFLPAKTYEVSLASLSGTVKSSVPSVLKCSTDPRGVIAGSFFAVLLFCVLVFLAVFVLILRPDLIRKKTFISGTELSTKKCSAVSVEMFAEHFRQLSLDENKGFSLEYESLMHVGTEQTQKVALLPENKAKNRFNNVLPYDWCRVKLSTSESSETSHYINANYMPGYSANREYIATQGPLPSTVNDFWRMVWEQRVGAIVMVTNCTEGGRTKCEQYWPAYRTTSRYGELLATLTSEQQEPNWTLREFNVKHENTSEQHTVTHFHFTSWPDHGVPQGTKVLIQFRGLVRQHIERERTRAPTVVHCSAGVGRTGTIIALDVLLQQLDRRGEVDINGFVHKMRLNRPHMVQTESQYVFLHQCIMDSLQLEEKTDEHIYENTDMIYVNARAVQEFRYNSNA